jgi:two-component system, OmpR family, sensor histidine kinase QseC
MLKVPALHFLRRACTAVVSVSIGLPLSKLARWWRPSLLLRVLLTATAVAFTLVWFALMAYGYHEATDATERDKQYLAFGDGLLLSLENTTDAHQARAIAAAFVDRMNESRRLANTPGLLQLRVSERISGKPVYSSGDLPDGDWFSGPQALHSARVDSQTHHFYFGEAARWRLQIASPEPSALWLLWMLAKNLLPNLLIAFPLVVLPLWLAARHGLEPLKALGEQITARQTDDVSRLKVSTPHAELTPLVDAINGLTTRLAHKMQTERAFVQDAAHELRTPLAVVSTQAHVLMKSDSPASRELAGERLQEAITRASHLVQQLLALTQVDSDRQVTLERLDLAQLVRDQLAELASLPGNSSIDLSLEAPDHFFAHVDRLAFQSVLHNLLGNAITHGGGGGLGHRVVTCLYADETQWQLSVADNGPGIAPADQPRVFERFFRAAPPEVTGSGLGLAIAAQGASRLGGHIDLHAGLDGRGCCFTLTVALTAT